MSTQKQKDNKKLEVGFLRQAEKEKTMCRVKEKETEKNVSNKKALKSNQDPPPQKNIYKRQARRRFSWRREKRKENYR